MIGTEHFLAQIKKLEAIFEHQLSDAQIKAYYETLSPDFTDEQFDKALNYALKTSFKFPPIAAFYKNDPSAPEVKTVYDPVTPEEAERIKAVRARYES